MDLRFTIRQTTATPTIVSYWDSKEMMNLFAHNGRMYAHDHREGLVLYNYDQGNKEINKETRLTISGDHESFSALVNGEIVNSNVSDWRSITIGGTWVLGQQQDYEDGGFDDPDMLKGKVCGFQIWDFKMTKEQLKILLSSKSSLKGNIFDSPASYQYELRGNAKESNGLL